MLKTRPLVIIDAINKVHLPAKSGKLINQLNILQTTHEITPIRNTND
jgi:hypothetical protein